MAADKTTNFDSNSVNEEFGAALNRLLPTGLPTGTSPALITALSGGADSTALCLLAARYAKAHGLAHWAIIIDHGLRDNSRQEAARVAQRMQDRGIKADIITIEQPHDGGGIQEWARTMRYDALLDQVRQSDAGNACLLLAHHAGDQAETIAMRLARGSGLTGLAGMVAHSRMGDVTVLRPMLTWPASYSRQICASLDCGYEDDPSNLDRRFDRVRTRQMLASLEQSDISPSMSQQLTRLGGLAGRLCKAVDRPLDSYLPALHPAGYALLDTAALEALSPALWNRVITRLLGMVAAGHYPPSRKALAILHDRIGAGKAGTLGGGKFTPKGDGYLVTREIGRTPPRQRIEAGRMVLFDNLWRFRAPQSGVVTLLGDVDRRTSQNMAESVGLPRINPDEIYENIPHLARIAIPVIDTLEGKRLYPQVKDVEINLPTLCGYSVDHCYQASNDTSASLMTAVPAVSPKAGSFGIEFAGRVDHASGSRQVPSGC
ncbi:tRNA lysidine(34) synthetase TilS [Alphaproteobacteria bacterium]|nr:tRNA lysidine(34) synthetase TilS [Alphaproteobacteria bacterium]